MRTCLPAACRYVFVGAEANVEGCSEIEDCNKTWAFPSDHFDYIHIRWLVGSVTDWYHLFERAFEHLRSDGWLESYEFSCRIECEDGELPEDSASAFVLLSRLG